MDLLELTAWCLDHKAQLEIAMLMPGSGANHQNPHFQKIQGGAETPLEEQALGETVQVLPQIQANLVPQ